MARRGVRRCTVCGGDPRGRYWISRRGETTCVSHEVLARCQLCGLPRSHRSSGWTEPAAGFSRCPACTADAVDRQVDARRLLPAVRRELAALGLQLRTPVRVELADLATVRARVAPRDEGDRRFLGCTELRRAPGATTRQALLITVTAGLDRVGFGATVAHEATHAWLGEIGAPVMDQRIEEGICEVFAAAWLKRRRTPFADAAREDILTNPDPVYGDGVRLVHAAVRAHGIGAVLAGIRRSGSLAT